MTQQDRPDSSTKTGKAVSYGGGTGIGAILYDLVQACPNEHVKAALILCIPALSIGIADFAKNIFDERKKTRERVKRDRNINKRIIEINSYLENKDLNKALKKELKEKRDRAISSLFDN